MLRLYHSAIIPSFHMMAHSFISYDGAFLHFIWWRIPSFHMMAHSFISYDGAYCLHSCYDFITPPSFLHFIWWRIPSFHMVAHIICIHVTSLSLRHRSFIPWPTLSHPDARIHLEELVYI